MRKSCGCLQVFCETGHPKSYFGARWCLQNRKWRQNVAPRQVKWRPKVPKGARMNQKRCQRIPKGSQLEPKGCQVEPKGCQRGAKGSPKCDFMKICVLHSKYKVFCGSRGASSEQKGSHFGTIFDQKSDQKSMQKSIPTKWWNLMPKGPKMMLKWIQQSWFFEFVCEKVILWTCEFYCRNTVLFEVSPIKNPSKIDPTTIQKS